MPQYSRVAHAGIPLWTFAPDANYPPTATVAASGTATVKYIVTNQSVKSHTLVMTAIPGITPTVTGCAASCPQRPDTLCLPTKGSSCTLTLTVNGGQLLGNVTAGPELCQQGGGRLQCYTPANPLAISLSAISKPTIAVLPTALALTEGGTADYVTVTNQSADVAIDNLKVEISSGSEVTLSNQSTCTSTLTASSTCTYYFFPGHQEEMPTATISGSNIAASVPVTITVGAASSTTLTVPPTGIIPVNDGQGSLVVTNTGQNTAYNVQAVLPTEWVPAVFQNSSDCRTIASGETCTLSFSSTTPYVAQGGIPVTGNNIPSPPKTALAFSMDGYLVWSVSGTSPSATALVIGSSDASNLQYWSTGFVNIPGITETSLTSSRELCNGATDGACDTGQIEAYYKTPYDNYAAGLCYRITSDSSSGTVAEGTWYLPAICQMGGAGQGAGCTLGLANIDTNLVQLGFSGLSGSYWSSTESSGSPLKYVWLENFASHSGSGQSRDLKNVRFSVRCARAFPY